MKKLLTLVAAAAFSTLVPTAHAQTATNDFNVTVNLSSQCRATNNNSQTVDFGTYTAFQGGIQGSTTAQLLFECTRGFAPTTVAFDTVNGTAGGVGVLAGLQYTLTTAAVVVTGGTPATTVTTGTGDTRRYDVSGTMPAGQAGTAPSGAASHVRTLILTY